jgi:outer membrane protein TolC
VGEPSGAARWTLEPWQAPEPVPVEEGPWIEQALAARPELIAIEWEIRAREDEEALAGSDWLAGSGAGVDAERDGDWSVGPGLSLPLPIFGAGGARRTLARALTAEERHRRTEAQRLAVLEVRAGLASLLGAQADLARVQDELLPQQERRREQAEAAQRLGQLDVGAVLLAEDALQDALARRIELEREVSDALYRLERAVGGPTAFQAVRNTGTGARS